MRILFYVDDGGSTGGPGMHSVRLWRALAERAPGLVGPLVIPRSESDRKIFADQIGDENVREVAGGSLIDAAADPVIVRRELFAELCALARREGCDHLHVLWGFLHPAQLEAVAPGDRLPVTVTLCDASARGEDADIDAMYFGSERWERYLRETLRAPLGYLAISDKTRADALAKGVPAALVETVHLWVDPALASMRSDEHDEHVAYVGAIAAYKGVDHILDFARAYPKYPVRMSGYGAADFPVEWPEYPSVSYLGYIPYVEVVRLIARARALLFLSYSEGFGLPMLEAQTLGVPLIINPRNVMVKELLAPGSYVSAGNVASPTSIKAAIDVAVRDREALVAAGYANAARFAEARQVDRLLSAFHGHHARLRQQGWGA